MNIVYRENYSENLAFFAAYSENDEINNMHGLWAWVAKPTPGGATWFQQQWVTTAAPPRDMQGINRKHYSKLAGPLRGH